MRRIVMGRVRSARESGEAGQGLVEYTFLLALITVVCVGALMSLGETIQRLPGWLLFG